jgi:uncharacterized membrane protein YphA (DoxX/SURF4 family)
MDQQTTPPLNTLIKRSGLLLFALVVLRTIVGWHFLYEGLVKLNDPHWSAVGYLKSTDWLLSGAFHWIADHAVALRIVDLLNVGGLTLIGLGLMLGLFSRLSSVLGAALLCLYYLAHPPLAGLGLGTVSEGSYLLIDKNVVEFFALLALTMVPTGRFIGVDGIIDWRRRRRALKAAPATADAPAEPPLTGMAASRRELLRHLATVPALGAFAYAYQQKHDWKSFEIKNLMSHLGGPQVDAVSGASMKTLDVARFDQLKGQVPHAKVGKLELSRMFLGGNLIGGWAHSRDLLYVSDLVVAYHHDRKVFETFYLAEQCGMNTILCNPRQGRVINDYWRKEGGKIQFISDCAMDGPIKGAQKSIDYGAHSCYLQGGMGDSLVADQKFDQIAEFMELVRKNGLPVGLGAHKLETIQGYVKQGFKPDYWVKTLHHTNYWSAKTQPEQDNIWCRNPEETIAFMEQLQEPWIAFKILAAGAIHPNEGIPYAFKNGADFITMGMYDFQIVKNVNLFLDTWNNLGERKRPFRV